MTKTASPPATAPGNPSLSLEQRRPGKDKSQSAGNFNSYESVCLYIHDRAQLCVIVQAALTCILSGMLHLLCVSIVLSPFKASCSQSAAATVHAFEVVVR